MKQRGIGDTFKLLTNALGIKTCEACEERRVRWNKIISYTTKPLFDESTIQMIEEYLNEPEVTKVMCRYFNELMKEYDGIWSDSCFCTKSQRIAFRKEFQTWYKNKLSNDNR